MDVYNFVSFFGVFILLGFAWLLSSNRRNVNVRLIFWALVLQVAIASFIFLVPAGSKLFLFVNDAVVKVLESASAGAKFVFGPLAIGPGQTDGAGRKSLGFILAFQGFPTIIFFSALISVLYFLNIMPVIIRGFAWIFTKLMKISGAESLVAASNIFVGIESALTVKPYLKKMTSSEYCTILTAGMATVASNVLALYVFSLQDVFPMIAGHLVSASLLSAPAAVVMSKLILPEDGQPETLGVNVSPAYDKDKSLFEAIINGSMAGVKMIVGITALLIAVLGLVALFDLILSAAGDKANLAFGMEFDWSLESILGYVFYPFALILGVPPADAAEAGRIIGQRLVVTEVVAYNELALSLEQGVFRSPRTAVIVTYALCGFAHLASMAIFVGGLCALVPGRKTEITKVAPRALAAATLACFMTACIAGAFYTKGSILLGGQ